jgi:ribosomal-protein-alanine N-acetyltransferase
MAVFGWCSTRRTSRRSPCSRNTVARAVGRELLDWLLRRAESMGANIARLEVRESNAAARALYEAAGFREIGIRKGYYTQNNESAVVMSLALRGT